MTVLKISTYNTLQIQIVTKLKCNTLENSKCDKTQTKMVTSLKICKCDQIHPLNGSQNSKTLVLKKKQDLNSDEA